MIMNPKVDFYFNKNTKWQEEINLLRNVVLSCNLVEVLKWGVPCYTYKDSNIVLIHVFKEYCALLFFKGALLNDPGNMLIQQTENVQSARQARFTNINTIINTAATLKQYIYEAIEIDKAGLKVTLKKPAAFSIPPELEERLRAEPALQTAFYALTPGRQRAYLLYFSAPKQAKTRITRMDKYTQAILNGKGLND